MVSNVKKGGAYVIRPPASPLIWIGGKGRAISRFLKQLPVNYHTCVSPFLGGGAFELFLSSLGVKVYGYDTNSGLVNFFKEFISGPDKVADRFLQYSNNLFVHTNEMKSRGWGINLNINLHDKLRKLHPEIYFGKISVNMSNLDNAALFLLFNLTSFGGCPGTRQLSRYENGLYNRCKNIRDKLLKFNTNTLTVGNKDFRESLLLHNNCFAYIDPPYVGLEKYYKNNKFPHKELADILNKRYAPFMLSYNNVPEIKKLYKNYRIEEISWYSSMRGGNNIELLIMNYSGESILWE